jgi:hypothetical protein
MDFIPDNKVFHHIVNEQKTKAECYWMFVFMFVNLAARGKPGITRMRIAFPGTLEVDTLRCIKQTP